MDYVDIKEGLSRVLAIDLHNIWREKRRLNGDLYLSRIKYSEDDIWNLNHGTNIVDLANCEFYELPSNWKEEYLNAARVVINLVYEKTISLEDFSSVEIEEMASVIHDEWLKRNDWVYDSKIGNPKLTVPYKELSDEEKKKDREQILPAINVVKAYMNGLIDLEKYNDKKD